MNDSSTYQAVRIGDTADWRLICVISARGMSAYLRHIDPTQSIITLFDEKWQGSEDTLLELIENKVYDNPQILDDFSADIVLVAPKAIWVPTRLVADDEDEAGRLYAQVYAYGQADVMEQEVGDATCLYSLVPGLKAFLQRTFPGARVHSHLAVMVRNFRQRSADMPRIYVEIREGNVDFIAFNQKNLLMSATHPWSALEDIEYHLYNIMDIYGLDSKEVQISISGLREVKTELMNRLREHIRYVMLTMMPGIGVKSGMPLPASLLLRQDQIKE